MSQPTIYFFDTVVPELIAREDSGLLVVKKEGACGVTLYWRHPTGLDLIDTPRRLVSYVSQYYRPSNDPQGRFSNLAQAGALLGFECTAAWLDNPAWSIDRIMSTPGLIFNQGSFVSPPKGLSREHRTFSLVQPLNPAPSEGKLNRFLDAFGLEAGARARIVAFYVGCLLRPCFGIMPGLLMRSPYKNTGKSTICKLASMMVLDTPSPPVLSWRGDDEFAKQIGSAIKEARAPVYVLDNVVNLNGQAFCSPTIATMTTSATMETRLLGRNQSLTLERPILAVSMQGGQIGHDLVDRFLYAEITMRRPVILDCDMLVYAEQNFRSIRDELATAIMRSKPLGSEAIPKNDFRYTDFWRYVSPVVSLMGLNSDLILESAADSAQSELIELAHLLVTMGSSKMDGGWFKVSDVHSYIVGTYHHKSLRTVISDSLSKPAQLIVTKELLASMPEAIQDAGYRLLISSKEVEGETLYHADIEVTS